MLLLLFKATDMAACSKSIQTLQRRKQQRLDVWFDHFFFNWTLLKGLTVQLVRTTYFYHWTQVELNWNTSFNSRFSPLLRACHKIVGFPTFVKPSTSRQTIRGRTRVFPEHAFANIFIKIEQPKQGWSFLFTRSQRAQNAAGKCLPPTQCSTFKCFSYRRL